MGHINALLDYCAPVNLTHDKEGILTAAKFIGVITTIACALFASTLPATTAAVFGVASVSVLIGGMTNRPHLVYFGLTITALWLTSFVGIEVLCVFDFPSVIAL
jgi:hypothetical protein